MLPAQSGVSAAPKPITYMARTPRNSCVHVRPAYKVLVAVGVCWLWIVRRADRQSSTHFFTFQHRVRPISLEFAKIDATTCSIAPEQSDFVRYSSLKASELTSRSADRYDCAGRCSVTSTCFLGYCSCHPGYGGTWCTCLLYTSPSPRDRQKSRMPSSA